MSRIDTPSAFSSSEGVVQQENAALSEGADAAANTGTAYSMGVGDTFSGSIGAVGDNDWIAITLTAGSNTQISLTSTGATGLDTYLELYDSSGTLVAFNDDGGGGLNSMLSFAATTGGTYYINARSYNNATAGTYQISTAELGGALPTYSYDQIADYLESGFWADTGRLQRSFNVGADGSIDVDITSLTAAGQQLATWALEAWTSVTGIAFNFVDETFGATAEIFFDDAGTGLDAHNISTTSGTTILRSEITITTDWINSPGHGGTGIDSYSFQTYMHELGHALGLGHAGNYNGSATYVTTAGGSGNNHYLNDSWQATIMSYFSQTDNTSINASYAYTVTPMIADILAIQSLYGVGGNLRTGNTTYGENSNAGGYLNSLTGLTNAVAITALDDGGVDTFDFGSATANQVIDLREEAISNIYGLNGNLVIARGTVIENVISGSGADTITGNSANNVITGGGGADVIDGGGGTDTAIFLGSHSLYSVTITGGTISVSSGGTTATLTNVELLRFVDNDGSSLQINFDLTNSNGWSQIATTRDTNNNITNVVTTLDTGAYFSKFFDVDGVQLWQTSTTGKSATNATDYNDIVYNDGTRIFTDYDQDNSLIWTTSLTFYNDLGQQTARRVNYDDGRFEVINQDFDSSQVWTTKIDTYTDGVNRDYVNFYNDDGTRTTVDFDQLNNQTWSSKTIQYDADGDATSFIEFNDDGTRRSKVFDPDNANVWNEILIMYDATGAQDYRRDDYDDGTFLVRDFDNLNVETWDTHFKEYDANGNLVQEYFI